jgi:predicted RNA binding protein YcfA (HicA-like mRNA interferase family)
MRPLKGREVLRAFERAGFSVVRTSASHSIMKKNGHPGTVSVPIHGGHDIKRGTLNGMIRSAGLTTEQFWEFVDS